MKKYVLSGIVILAIIAVIGYYRHNQLPTINPGPAVSLTSTSKDGTYTGSVTDAFYGNVQVQATISNGRLTEVQFLQYPSDRRQSQEINSVAMPQLVSEAISAQSSQVDAVSGATQTSQAFMQSLSAALAQAKL